VARLPEAVDVKEAPVIMVLLQKPPMTGLVPTNENPAAVTPADTILLGMPLLEISTFEQPVGVKVTVGDEVAVYQVPDGVAVTLQVGVGVGVSVMVKVRVEVRVHVSVGVVIYKVLVGVAVSDQVEVRVPVHV
jgi:hypothetical protein